MELEQEVGTLLATTKNRKVKKTFALLVSHIRHFIYAKDHISNDNAGISQCFTIDFVPNANRCENLPNFWKKMQCIKKYLNDECDSSGRNLRSCMWNYPNQSTEACTVNENTLRQRFEKKEINA